MARERTAGGPTSAPRVNPPTGSEIAAGVNATTDYIRNFAESNAGLGVADVAAQAAAAEDGFPDGKNEDDDKVVVRRATSSRKGYEAAVLPSATSQADYINAMYNANEQRQRAALAAEYDANVGALDRQAAGIPAQYQTAANQAASQAAINRANFNEMAAANGLNTGAAGQAALAQNNALLANISSIRQAQSEAMNDVEKQRVQLSIQYQKAIAQAIANNEADRAAALYNEAKRVDESLVSTAVNQATENFRAWQAKYG